MSHVTMDESGNVKSVSRVDYLMDMARENGTARLIEVGLFDSLVVIVFNNKSTNLIDAFVCETPAVAKEEEKKLRAMSHIEIIKITNASVKGMN